MNGTCRERHNRRLEALKKERTQWEAHWQDLNDYIIPGRLRLTHGTLRGQKLTDKIVDNSPLLSWRVARSGMHSGLTSPTRPWMKYSTFDAELREIGPVKSYLNQASETALSILGVSNVYNVLHAGYGDLLLFGQFAMLLVKDEKEYLRAIPCQHGQFWIAQDHKHMVNTLYRRLWMTVEQVVGQFVAQPGGKMDWSVASNTVKSLWDKAQHDEWVEIIHATEPRLDREYGKEDGRNKPVCSNYFEAGGDSSSKMLREAGFGRSPIIAPRWDVIGEDVYGISPGQDALPDVKMLQVEQKRKGEAIDKMVRPPMLAPNSMKNQKTSILPGSITYVDSVGTAPSYRPAFQVDPRTGELGKDIVDTTRRIERAFYADLFMAISQMEGVQPRNALELTQRKEEQLLQLGPVIERQNHELINVLADIVFDLMIEDKMLPPPPQELQGKDLRTENISILAQAQQAVHTGGIERLVSFAGNLAAAKPDILDKVDLDQTIDEYADALGVTPRIVRTDDAVAKIRGERQQAMAQQQQTEQAVQMMPAMKQGAEAAKVLAEADNNGGPGDLLRRIGLTG